VKKVTLLKPLPLRKKLKKMQARALEKQNREMASCMDQIANREKAERTEAEKAAAEEEAKTRKRKQKQQKTCIFTFLLLAAGAGVAAYFFFNEEDRCSCGDSCKSS